MGVAYGLGGVWFEAGGVAYDFGGRGANHALSASAKQLQRHVEAPACGKVAPRVLGFQHFIGGERERSPPLPEIMQSRFPHLGNSLGSAKHGVQWLSLAEGEPPS